MTVQQRICESPKRVTWFTTKRRRCTGEPSHHSCCDANYIADQMSPRAMRSATAMSVLVGFWQPEVTNTLPSATKTLSI
jgi:hypothetical protein